MCPPKKETSYNADSAKKDALLDFAIGAGTDLFADRADRSSVDKQNRAILRDHKRKEHAYLLKFNNDVIKWQNEQQDIDAQTDNEFLTAMGNIAQSDVSLWNSISEAGNDAQAAYAAMMAIGAGEQAGRRSAASIDPRKAMLEYGEKMNAISSKVSFDRDNTILNNDVRRSTAERMIWSQEMKAITGRPMPGTPPALHEDDFIDYDPPVNLALNIARRGLDAKRTYDELKPPTTKRKETDSTKRSLNDQSSTFLK